MVLNVAGYRFFELKDPQVHREPIRTRARSLGVMGSVLLSEEGVNCFAAGPQDAILAFKRFLFEELEFPRFELKESWSETLPFKRMVVKVKKEIISMDSPEFQPREEWSQRLGAQTLKAWLDEGRDVVLLDTRNAFEVDHGSFKNAIHLGLEDFREFPERVRSLDGRLKEKPVVTFCTGGIRCEKAVSVLHREGFREIYQLDGGILKYFEKCGDAHYDGDCFVFDYRVAVNGRLDECKKPHRKLFDFRWMRNGSPRQKEVFRQIHWLRFFDHLAPFHPVLVGDYALDVDTEASEVLILTRVSDFARFERAVREHWGEYESFGVSSAAEEGRAIVTAGFRHEGRTYRIRAENREIPLQAEFKRTLSALNHV